MFNNNNMIFIFQAGSTKKMLDKNYGESDKRTMKFATEYYERPQSVEMQVNNVCIFNRAASSIIHFVRRTRSSLAIIDVL